MALIYHEAEKQKSPPFRRTLFRPRTEFRLAVSPEELDGCVVAVSAKCFQGSHLAALDCSQNFPILLISRFCRFESFLYPRKIQREAVLTVSLCIFSGTGIYGVNRPQKTGRFTLS